MTIKNTKKLLTGLLVVLFAVNSSPVFAALGLKEATEVASNQGLFEGSIEGLIKTVILRILSVSAILALAALIWAGFLYITAFTNEDNTKKAKNVAKYAIGGLIFIALAFLIIEIIGILFTT